MATLFFSLFFLALLLPAARPPAEIWRIADTHGVQRVGHGRAAERIPGGEFTAAAARFLNLKSNLFAAALYAPAAPRSPPAPR